ncbi:hypothetical protein AFK64_04865 [Cronobacter sakazakii]|nr:hypothetical protein AFK64_04865 [Cronobacter sakazakii]
MNPSPGDALVCCVKNCGVLAENKKGSDAANYCLLPRLLLFLVVTPGRYPCLFPAALFWSWPPVVAAQPIYRSLRRPALQFA